MSILYPVSGGFYTWAVRFLDPSFAFAMGWNYVFQWAVALPLEITVAATTVNYWPNNVPFAAWITVFWMAIRRSIYLTFMRLITSILIVIVSIFGTLGFAEEEFWSSCLKLVVVVMFILIGMWVIPSCPRRDLIRVSISVCICGGGPDSGEYNHYIGGLRWHDPGAFANGFQGLCAVFVTGKSSVSFLKGLY